MEPRDVTSLSLSHHAHFDAKNLQGRPPRAASAGDAAGVVQVAREARLWDARRRIPSRRRACRRQGHAPAQVVERGAIGLIHGPGEVARTRDDNVVFGRKHALGRRQNLVAQERLGFVVAPGEDATVRQMAGAIERFIVLGAAEATFPS